MSLTQFYTDQDDLHPIDIVETIAASKHWEFDRIGDDQIAMAVEGQWRGYSITLAWSEIDETLRLICTFELEPPQDKLLALYEVLNGANDMVWSGAFTYWNEQRLMVYRYGLGLAGGQSASSEQIDRMIHAAVGACEKFYPAFQLVTWGNRPAADALQIAMNDAYGRA